MRIKIVCRTPHQCGTVRRCQTHGGLLKPSSGFDDEHVVGRIAPSQSNLCSYHIVQRTANMRAATRVFPAILILAGFFLIRIYLYRLPIADAFHGSNFKSLVGVEDDASTEVDETVDLASVSATNDGRIEATTTPQDGLSATATAVIQEQASATGTSPSSSDQIVVIGKTESEDTSWVDKLPTSVFSAS